MKLRIFTLLIVTAIFFSSCQKDAVGPEIQKYEASQNSVAAWTSLSQGTNTIDTRQYMQLQLAKDSLNTDNIIISFNANAKTSFVRNEDSPTLSGMSFLGLSSLSSDNIPLAINILPLPKQSLTIGLKVKATQNGIYNLTMKTLKSIPSIFEVWLMDNYKKDSLDYRHNTRYDFNVNTTDTGTYGAHRFTLVVRQNKALSVHLLNFTAAKASGTTQINWVTENEDNYTGFAVERSTNNGQTFTALTTLASSSAGTYSYQDKTPVAGNDKYRLKITDLNGTVSYSGVISLDY